MQKNKKNLSILSSKKMQKKQKKFFSIPSSKKTLQKIKKNLTNISFFFFFLFKN